MEEGMQQATPEHGQEEQAPAEGDSRLEIERLRKIIQDYAAICQHSQKAIHDLEEKLRSQPCPHESELQNKAFDASSRNRFRDHE
jgi:hypothetical protein